MRVVYKCKRVNDGLLSEASIDRSILNESEKIRCLFVGNDVALF